MVLKTLATTPESLACREPAPAEPVECAAVAIAGVSKSPADVSILDWRKRHEYEGSGGVFSGGCCGRSRARRLENVVVHVQYLVLIDGSYNKIATSWL